MLRAVVDPGVLVSALISSKGPPSLLLEELIRPRLRLVASPLLRAERSTRSTRLT
jgi:predicted nucleic acid-binding protein